MFRLSREVRFSINAAPDGQLAARPANSYAGFPSPTGLAYFFALRATYGGPLDAQSSYLQNIKLIDAVVRQQCIPVVERALRAGHFRPGTALIELFDMLRDPWPGSGITLDRLALALNPFLCVSICVEEYPMTRLSQKFEFSASHRLHNPALSDAANRQTFGKCNNPHGHGHNYELQVTLRGTPDERTGLLVDVPAFERVVAETVVERFDHKNLNSEVPEFREVIPSVENIARVIYGLLRPKFQTQGAALAAVTVWETPKTWCEYSE